MRVLGTGDHISNLLLMSDGVHVATAFGLMGLGPYRGFGYGVTQAPIVGTPALFEYLGLELADREDRRLFLAPTTVSAPDGSGDTGSLAVLCHIPNLSVDP